MKDSEPVSDKPLIDGHAHLAEMEDWKSVIIEAREAGITAIVAVGMDIDSNCRTLQIAEENRGFVFPAIGYHPWALRSPDVEKTLAFLEEHIKMAVALGEVGIDFTTTVSKSLQEEVFAAIVAMARRHDKALIIHGLKAYQQVLSLLKEHAVTRAVFHWYADSLDLLREIIENGYYISATPALLYNQTHQTAIREAPLSRIILETDCPERYRDFIPRSAPRDLLVTLREVARIKDLPLADVLFRTSENISDLLGLSGFTVQGSR